MLTTATSVNLGPRDHFASRPSVRSLSMSDALERVASMPKLHYPNAVHEATYLYELSPNG